MPAPVSHPGRPQLQLGNYFSSYLAGNAHFRRVRTITALRAWCSSLLLAVAALLLATKTPNSQAAPGAPGHKSPHPPSKIRGKFQMQLLRALLPPHPPRLDTDKGKKPWLPGHAYDCSSVSIPFFLTGPSSSPVSLQLLRTTAIWGREPTSLLCMPGAVSTVKETEAARGSTTCPRSHQSE